MNGLKTAMLLGLLSSLLIVGGGAVAGKSGLYMGLLLAVGMNFFSYFFSEKMALRAYHAQPVTPTENAEIYHKIYPMTARLCQRAGIPVPKLWVVPDESPNAFATGRNPNNASVAVTVGLLRLMNDQELEGVIAHELGHIKNRDILISSIAATIASAISFLGQMAMFGGMRGDDEEGGSPIGGLLMIFLGPIAAGIIQMAISRTREYSADAAAAQFSGTPNGLISALQKLETWSQRIPMHATPSTAHMMIFPPVLGGLARLFSTHPATADRIAHLRSLR
jgi:heat shock protein HtpX